MLMSKKEMEAYRKLCYVCHETPHTTEVGWYRVCDSETCQERARKLRKVDGMVSDNYYSSETILGMEEDIERLEAENERLREEVQDLRAFRFSAYCLECADHGHTATLHCVHCGKPFSK